MIYSEKVIISIAHSIFSIRNHSEDDIVALVEKNLRVGYATTIRICHRLGVFERCLTKDLPFGLRYRTYDILVKRRGSLPETVTCEAYSLSNALRRAFDGFSSPNSDFLNSEMSRMEGRFIREFFELELGIVLNLKKHKLVVPSLSFQLCSDLSLPLSGGGELPVFYIRGEPPLDGQSAFADLDYTAFQVFLREINRPVFLLYTSPIFKDCGSEMSTLSGHIYHKNTIIPVGLTPRWLGGPVSWGFLNSSDSWLAASPPDARLLLSRFEFFKRGDFATSVTEVSSSRLSGWRVLAPA